MADLCNQSEGAALISVARKAVFRRSVNKSEKEKKTESKWQEEEGRRAGLSKGLRALPYQRGCHTSSVWKGRLESSCDEEKLHSP